MRVSLNRQTTCRLRGLKKCRRCTKTSTFVYPALVVTCTGLIAAVVIYMRRQAILTRRLNKSITQGMPPITIANG